MTKYILHGGHGGKICDNEKDFFHEMVGALPSGASILLIYFHVDQRDIVSKFEENRVNFSEYAKGKELNLMVAKKEKFMEQLEKADALFIRGGDTNKLIDILKKYSGLTSEIRKKKVVAGISAGAYVLSEYFYTNGKDYVDKGLGVLPIRTRCHYDKKDDQKISEKFGKFPESLKHDLVLIKNCEFKVFNQ